MKQGNRGLIWAGLIALLVSATMTTTALSQNAPKLIDTIDFDEADLDVVVDYFREKSAELSAGKGWNILVDPLVDKETKVSLKLHRVPAGVAFAYLAEATGNDYRIDPSAIVFQPKEKATAQSKAKAKAVLQQGSRQLAARARAINLDQIELTAAPLKDVLEYLSDLSREKDPKGQGVNVIPGYGVDPEIPITLKLNDVPFTTVLKYISELTQLKIRIDGWAVVLEAPAPPPKKTANASPNSGNWSASVKRSSSRPQIEGSPNRDPRSPAHKDYVHSTDSTVPERSNSLGNTYAWVGGKWTYVGKEYKKVNGQWVKVNPNTRLQTSSLQPAKGLGNKSR